METALRITDWFRCYEVDDKGRQWEPGAKLREAPLGYIRDKVRAPHVGPGRLRFNRACRRAGLRQLEVIGLWCELRELAGHSHRPLRGWLVDDRGRPVDAAWLSEQYDYDDVGAIERMLAVLADENVRWIERASFAPGTIWGIPGSADEAALADIAGKAGMPHALPPPPPLAGDGPGDSGSSRNGPERPGTARIPFARSTETETEVQENSIQTETESEAQASGSASARNAPIDSDSDSASDGLHGTQGDERRPAGQPGHPAGSDAPAGTDAAKARFLEILSLTMSRSKWVSGVQQMLDGRFESIPGRPRDKAQRSGDQTHLERLYGQIVDRSATGTIKDRLREAFNLLADKCRVRVNGRLHFARPIAPWVADMQDRGWIPAKGEEVMA